MRNDMMYDDDTNVVSVSASLNLAASLLFLFFGRRLYLRVSTNVAGFPSSIVRQIRKSARRVYQSTIDISHHCHPV
jgi:hypothetical protein